MSSLIVINGQSFHGNNVSFKNGKIIIDGREAQYEDAKILNVKVEGDIQSLDVGSANTIEISGNVGSVETTNGDVNIAGSVNGDVETTNGNVTCGSVAGKVKTVNGNIKHR